MAFNITEHVQGVQYLLRFWRSDFVLNLNTHFYSVVFDLFCIFQENTHEQQLIQAKILYQCPSRNILDFVYGGSHFSTGAIFRRVRHVKNRPLWHFFYTWDTFFYGQGSFLYDEKWPLGRFSTGVVIRRYTVFLTTLVAFSCPPQLGRRAKLFVSCCRPYLVHQYTILSLSNLHLPGEIFTCKGVKS